MSRRRSLMMTVFTCITLNVRMSRRRSLMMTVFTRIILIVFLVSLQFAQCSKEVNHFKYLGSQISYENEKDIQQNYQYLLKCWEFKRHY